MKVEAVQGIDGRGPFCERLTLVSETEADLGKLAVVMMGLKPGSEFKIVTEAGAVKFRLPNGGGRPDEPEGGGA
jgi:hypothetical protein